MIALSAAEAVTGAEAVVTSTAVKGDNPEVIAARARRIPVVPRAVMLAELMRLRRAACDPRLVAPELGLVGAKVQEFERLALELVAGRHKALVFSQFTDFLKLLAERLDAAGLRQAIKAALSPRHVPNDIFQVSAIPRTLSGKKMELPVKKLLMGTPPEQVFKLDAMANMPDRPRSLQDHLDEQLGELDLDLLVARQHLVGLQSHGRREVQRLAEVGRVDRATEAQGLRRTGRAQHGTAHEGERKRERGSAHSAMCFYARRL